MAAAAGAALVLSIAPVAGAQQSGPTVTGSNFGIAPGPPNGTISTPAISVSGHFHADGFQPHFDWISVNLVWDKGGPPPPVPGPYTYCGAQPPSGPPAPACAPNDIDFDQALSPAPAYNGPYRVSATAQASDFPNRTATGSLGPIAFKLAVPPPTVQKVSATVKDRVVSVSWDRDAGTPDVFTYFIWRKGPDDKDFRPISQTPQSPVGARMTVQDDLSHSAGGDYLYQIEERRNGPTGDSSSFVASDRSKSQSNKVNLPDLPPGTPTTPTQPPAKGPASPPPVVRSSPSGLSSRSSSGSSSETTPTSEGVTPDPGFVRGLPYANRGKQNDQEGDNASVALTPGGRHKSNQKGVLTPVAIGSILFVGAFQLRWLKNRLDEQPQPLS